MTEFEKVQAMLKIAERFISVNQLDRYIEYLKMPYEDGSAILDNDIRKYSSDYCVANTIGL